MDLKSLLDFWWSLVFSCTGAWLSFPRFENNSNYTQGSDMMKLTLRKLSIIKHSSCKFSIKNLHSKSAVNPTPNKAFASFIFSQTVQL